MRLAQPIVGMAPTPSGHGYWLVARDGGIFAFGDARYFGSGGRPGVRHRRGHGRRRPTARGYWMSNSVGQVFTFGDAPYFGDLFPRGIDVASGIAPTAPTVANEAAHRA